MKSIWSSVTFKALVSLEMFCLEKPIQSLFLWIVPFNFLYYRIPLSISTRAGFVVTYSFSFCLSWKLFISPSILNESLARYIILGCMFFLFKTMTISCQPFLAGQVSVEKSAVMLILLPTKFRDFLSLAALRIF